MHPNSLTAYEQEAGKLAHRCNVIWEWLFHHGPATDRQVCRGMGYEDMNSVRPRITELIDLGYAEEIGTTRCEVTRKEVRLVRATVPQRKQSEFAL